MDLMNRDCDNLDDVLQDQVTIWNYTLGNIRSMTLKCAVELEIPDIIHNHGRAMSLEELTEALPIHPSKTKHVYRIMSLLVHSGFFAVEKDGYVLTRVSRLLLKTNPYSARHFVLATSHDVSTKPWHYMSNWFKNDDPTSFHTAFGEPFWVKAENEDSMSHLFNEMMASDSILLGRALTEKCKEVFEGLNSLVDVGGGTGTMAKTIVEAFPELECTVFDLPHVVAGLESTNNLKYIGGNMFETIPSADAIMLKCTLHNWGDEDCVKILRLCKEAITSKNSEGGKIIIIDIVLEGDKYDHNSVESQIYSDLGMMILVPGRERNEKEWAQIFSDAGFTRYKIHPVLGFRAVIEVFP